LNCQIVQIGGWIKIFVPFGGKLPSDFEGRLENNWLKLDSAKTQAKKYKKAANF
jgi:hypothetical protein